MKCKFMCFLYKYFLFSFITFQTRYKKVECVPLLSLGLCYDGLKIPSYSNEILMLFFLYIREVYSVSSNDCLLLKYRISFLLRISLQFSFNWRVQRINNHQLPSHYVQSSGWVIVRSVTTLFPLHFRYQTRVQNYRRVWMVLTYLQVFRSVCVKSLWQTTKNQSAYLVTEPKLD
jgi:hypothetical protein